MPKFDAIIIGAGQAGPPLIGSLTKAGMKVALIERHLFGGTCVNTGCIPTKTLIASAYAAHMARRAAFYGVTIPGEVSAVDMKAVQSPQGRGYLMASRKGVEAGLRNNPNCTVYTAHARFESPTTIRLEDDDKTLLEAPKIFLNVGARAVIPDLPGVDQVNTITNTSILELDTLPRHLVIIGGSYIGIEFGQMYRRFGSEVTIIEKGPRLIAHEDEDVSAAVKDILASEGINIRLNAECIHFRKDGEDSIAGTTCPEGAEPEIRGSHILLAVGRRPNTGDLGLDKASVLTDPHGNITIDDQLRTNIPGIYALGDCNGHGGFTHTSYNDYEIAAFNLLDPAAAQPPRKVSDRITCYSLYCDPPLGRIGLH